MTNWSYRIFMQKIKVIDTLKVIFKVEYDPLHFQYCQVNLNFLKNYADFETKV
jgi:hypothetical protein